MKIGDAILAIEKMRQEREDDIKKEQALKEKEESRNTILLAVRKYGVTPQIVVCMEEMAELTQALSKSIRGNTDYQNIAEEMADVEIMMAQMKVIFSNADDVEAEKKRKLNRLAERLK